MVSGILITAAVSFKTLGNMLSGPAALWDCTLNNLPLTVLTSIAILLRLVTNSRSENSGSSLVNTLVKNMFNNSAFSFSFDASSPPDDSSTNVGIDSYISWNQFLH